MVRRINKLLPNLACKLVYGDKVAYAEAKAHRGIKYNTVIVASERKSYSEEKSLCPDRADIVAISLARPLRWSLTDTSLRRAKAAKVRQGPGYISWCVNSLKGSLAFSFLSSSGYCSIHSRQLLTHVRLACKALTFLLLVQLFPTGYRSPHNPHWPLVTPITRPHNLCRVPIVVVWIPPLA